MVQNSIGDYNKAIMIHNYLEINEANLDDVYCMESPQIKQNIQYFMLKASTILDFCSFPHRDPQKSH